MSEITHLFSPAILLLQIKITDIAAIFSIVATTLMAVVVITGVVWWVFRGKTNAQLEEEKLEMEKRFKEDLERKDRRITELKENAEEAKSKKIEALEEKGRADQAKAEALVELTLVKKALSETEAKLARSLRREQDTAIELEKLKNRVRGAEDQLREMYEKEKQ